MKKRITKRDVVSLDFLAGHFSITKRWINRLSREKGFPRISRGKYDFKECARWFVDYYRRMADDARKDSQSLQRSEERKAQYQADMLEIRLKKERGLFIPKYIAIDVLDQAISASRSFLISIPKHAARELGNKEIEAYLENLIRKSLDELSTIPDRIFGAAGVPGGDPGILPEVESGSKTDGKRVGGPVPHALAGGKRRKRPVGNLKGGIPKGDDGYSLGSAH
jgi:phage terminase Nu1 subunit (DNA packaging protein)